MLKISICYHVTIPQYFVNFFTSRLQDQCTQKHAQVDLHKRFNCTSDMLSYASFLYASFLHGIKQNAGVFRAGLFKNLHELQLASKLDARNWPLFVYYMFLNCTRFLSAMSRIRTRIYVNVLQGISRLMFPDSLLRFWRYTNYLLILIYCVLE